MSQTLFPRIFPSVDKGSALKEFRPDLNIRLICPDCKNPQPNLIEEYASGDIVCRDCGLVLEDRIIDTRPEWRTFGDDERNSDPSRVGAAADPLLGNLALNTAISSTGGTNNQILIRTHIKATISKADMILKREFEEIEVMCDLMDLTKEISDTTNQLYKRVLGEKLLCEKNKSAMFAACIYMACRIKKVGRSFKEIYASTRVSERNIVKCTQILTKTFKFDVDPMTPEDLMFRISNKLNLPREIQKIATKLSKRIEELSLLTGRTQNNIAAVCIHYASVIFHHDIPVEHIAKVSGMATSSVKSAYHLLCAERDKFKDLIDIML